MTQTPTSSSEAVTEVRYEHSRDFPDLLAQLGISLLVSTYQADKVLVVGTREGKLSITFHNFDQPMGIAVSPRCLAIGTRRAVWFLSAADIDQSQSNGQSELGQGRAGAFVARTAFFTGSIHCHDLAWCSGELWIVNTLFSCLCVLHKEYSFVPRWTPPFITTLAAEDRCHLNGLAADGQSPRYVTVIACTDTPGGWRPDKAKSGCILELPSGQIVARGLSMPHSPRLHTQRLWVLDSGRGHLSLVDQSSGQVTPVAGVPGYTRGLAFYGDYAFVGLSRIRETNVFGGLPIAEKRDDLICGVGVIEWRTGRTVATFMLRSGVEEIYDVQVVPLRNLTVSGPHPDVDGSPVIWVVPPLDQQLPSAATIPNT